MKKIFICILSLLGILSLSLSCTDVVKVDLDQGQVLLVVDAWVNNIPGSQTIRLTTTSPYFSETNTPPVSGASVSINDLNNNKTYTFSDAGNGNYVFTPTGFDTLAIINHQYKLNITWQGYDYNSFATLNRTTKIDSIAWLQASNQPNQNGGLYPYIIAKDAPGEKDFYWIKAYQNNKYFYNSSAINVCEDAGGGDGTDGLYFIPPNAFFQVTPGDKPYHEKDTCRIEIHSISKSAFDFWMQAQNQINNSQDGLFANTPENIKTNIGVVTSGAPKALGWFNMAAVSSFTSYAKKP